MVGDRDEDYNKPDDIVRDAFEKAYFVRGSDTSEAAADEIICLASELRRRIYSELLKYPMGLTDHQLQDFLEMNPSTERPRRVELVRAGLVWDAGGRRRTPSGRLAVAWVARLPRPVRVMMIEAGC